MSISLGTEKSLDRQVTAAAWQEDPTVDRERRVDELPSPFVTPALPAPETSTVRRKLSLRDAIETALVQNPDAVTARAGGPVSDASRIVAATYPWNPTLQVGVDPYTRDRDGNFLATKNQVSVTQTLELAHQSRYRRQSADAGWNQQRAIVAQAEWTAAIAAMRAYFDALYRQALLELAKNSATLQTQMVGVVDRRFNAGLATPTERLTARVAARQSQRLAELADADYQTARNALRMVLNLSPGDQFGLANNLDAYKWLPTAVALDPASASGTRGDAVDLSDESSPWVSNRPDVVAASFAVSVARGNLELAKANLVPNVATGPTYERDESGTLFFGVAAQVDLPVWNSGCPLVRQRMAEYQQQLITWRQTQARAASEVQSAANRYAVALKLWNERWPDKEAGGNELASAANAFEQGQASILEVLAIQDSLIQERRSYLDLLNEISQAATDLIAALAIDPDCLIESPPTAVDNPAIKLAP